MQVTITNPNHSSQVFALFSEMREMEELCDIKLETSIDEIAAHKVVLAACNPYFRDLLKYLDTEEETCVIPDEHDSNVVSEIINYFYTGRLEIETVLLPDLLNTAMYFQATDIVERCEDHVVRQLNTDNCFNFYYQAKKFNLKDLQQTIIRFINWNFLELTEQVAFLKLSVEDVCAFACSDILNIEKEEDVYEALWKWFKHDEENRKCHCEEVFSNVRFFQFHPQFITERLIPELVHGEGVCKDQIKTAITFQSADKKKRKILLEKLNPRYPSKAIYMFNNKASVVEKYDPVAVECVKEKRMMNNKEISSDQAIFKAAVVVENELYVVSTGKVEKFNNLTLTWEKVGKGVSVQDSCLCTDKNCFYVIGGKDQSSQEKGQGLAVKCFNVLTLTWSNLLDMTLSRRSAACVANNGRIFVMGGYTFRPLEPLALTHRLSLRSNKWKELVPLNMARSGFNAIIVRNTIYAIGGRSDIGNVLNTIEMFDLDSEVEWVLFEHNMIHPRNDFGAAYFNGQIWCLGGSGQNSIERFDFGKKSWEMVGNLGEVRHRMSCVMYPLF